VSTSQVAQFGPFSEGGGKLLVGDYQFRLDTIMASLQPPEVQSVFGSQGVGLTGELISVLPGLNDRGVTYTFKFSINPDGTVSVRTLPPSAVQTFQPGFDCKYAKSKVEHLICADSDLSALDRQMNNVYKSGVEGSSPDQQLRIKQAQQRWRLEVRDACAAALCIHDAYVARLKVMSPTQAPQAQDGEVWEIFKDATKQILVRTNGFFYDRKSYSGTGFRTNVTYDLPESEIVGAAQSVEYVVEGYCEDKIYTILSTVFFSGKGCTVEKGCSGFPMQTLSADGLKRKLVSGSAFEKAFNSLCRIAQSK
jgi:uncharacterized protein